MRLAQAKFTDKSQWVGLPKPSDWDSPQTLILAFCAPQFFDKPEELKFLQTQYPQSVMVGCSTSGEIQGEELSDLSIVVSFCRFESANMRVASALLNGPEHSEQVGEKLARSLSEHAKLKGVLILTDGLKTNGSKLITGFNAALGDQKIPIGGGLAGDGNNFLRTFAIHSGEARANYCLAVGFYGDELEIQAGSRGGWDIFGPGRVITKSQGNILFEIDHRPALDLYKEYLGEKASELPASGLLFPLQISRPTESDIPLVRTILSVNEEQKSLIFAGDVPEGWSAQLMRANFDRIIDGAAQAFSSAHMGMKDSKSAELVIAVSCVGRRLVLGERTTEELEAVCSDLNAGSNVIGFYSYGELAPSTKDSACELHNQSMTTLIIREHAQGSLRKAG